MKHAISVVILVAALAVSSAARGQTCADAMRQSQLGIGFTLTHTLVNTDLARACASEGPGVTLSRSDNIILNYHHPEVRGRVQASLRQMAADGATVLRVIIWFGRRSTRADHVGIIDINDEQLQRQVTNNSIELARDIQSSGYRRLYMAFGPQGQLAPNCRRIEWGDCYDSTSSEQTWEFMRTIISQIKGATASSGPAVM